MKVSPLDVEPPPGGRGGRASSRGRAPPLMAFAIPRVTDEEMLDRAAVDAWNFITGRKKQFKDIDRVMVLAASAEQIAKAAERFQRESVEELRVRLNEHVPRIEPGASRRLLSSAARRCRCCHAAAAEEALSWS